MGRWSLRTLERVVQQRRGEVAEEVARVQAQLEQPAARASARWSPASWSSCAVCSAVSVRRNRRAATLRSLAPSGRTTRAVSDSRIDCQYASVAHSGRGAPRRRRPASPRAARPAAGPGVRVKVIVSATLSISSVVGGLAPQVLLERAQPLAAEGQVAQPVGEPAAQRGEELQHGRGRCPRRRTAGRRRRGGRRRRAAAAASGRRTGSSRPSRCGSSARPGRAAPAARLTAPTAAGGWPRASAGRPRRSGSCG